MSDTTPIKGHNNRAGWTRCRICDEPTYIRRGFKEDECPACVREVAKMRRWDAWDKNPELIHRYPNIYELIDYFESRCPKLAAELLGVDNDPYAVNYVVYRGKDIVEE